jgi:hypothetical protein
MEKRAALNFATSTVVIIVLSVVVLVLAVILVNSIIETTKIIKFEKVAPSYFESSVFPSEGRTGTAFKISLWLYNKTGIEFVTATILKNSQPVTNLNLYDDGNHGDEKADDSLFSNVWDSANQQQGAYSVSFTTNNVRYDNATSFQIYRANCLNLVNSGPPEDRIDIVFLGSEYKNLEKLRNDIIKDIDLSSKYNGIFSFEPFKENRGKFNIYYVNETLDLGCQLNCEGIQSMICCNDNKVVDAASQCPADQIIVLHDDPQFCGTATFYAKVCSYARSPIVLMHEFGHSFGGLGDEYNYEEVYPSYAKSISASELNFPNCDKPGCYKWQDITEGCWKGCSISALYRPTQNKCIMYTYVPEFDIVDTSYLKKLMFNYGQSNIEPQVLSRAAKPLGKSYFINIRYNGGVLTFENAYLAPGGFKAPDRNIDIQRYQGRLLSFDNKVLENFTFEIPRLIWAPMPENENETHFSPIVKDKFNYTLTIPYSDDGKRFEAYDRNNRKVLSVNLGYLADTCGNGACEPQENYLECPKDCSLEKPDNLCIPNSDGICDPDCKGKDPDCRKISSIIKENMVLIVLMAVLISLLILLLTSKPKK